MARGRRIKGEGDAFHHVMSRITGRQMLLRDPAVKSDMIDALERVAEFSGVDVGGFCVMDDHFHVVCRVSKPEGPVPENEILRRYAALKGRDAAGRLCEHLAKMRKEGGALLAEERLDQLRRRMHDLSEFMKTFKEEFGRMFRKRRKYVGGLWGDRFKSTLIGEAEYLRTCAKYVELNPVRAGLASRPEGYAWCTSGAAKRGSTFAKRCREFMAGVVCGVAGEDGSRDGWLWRRVPQIGAGRIFGSREFVSAALVRHSACVSPSARARPVAGGSFASHGHVLAWLAAKAA